MVRNMKRVVVTGMGAITPIGNSIDAFWESVKARSVLTESHILIRQIINVSLLHR